MTVQSWLKLASIRLSESGIESAQLESQVLLAHALGVERSYVLGHATDPLTVADEADRLLLRRSHQEPLAYILGYREFYGRKFYVNRNVLIPRQETEMIIEAVDDLVKEKDLPFEAKLIDVGCGSGCIGITIKLNHPTFNLALSDISRPALMVASKNCIQLEARAKLNEGSLLDGFNLESVDLIVSNPPYIADGFLLPDDVKHFEPPIALYGGVAGLDIYVPLIAQAAKVLKRGGYLILEIGIGQADAVRRIASVGDLDFVGLDRDLAGIPRIAKFRRP